MLRSVLLDRAAELLGVSRRTVYYRIRDGKLQTLRTRGGSQRVLLDSLERLLREERQERRARTARRMAAVRADAAAGAASSRW